MKRTILVNIKMDHSPGGSGPSKGEMNITIFDNSEEAVSYAEECVKAYNSLNNDKALLDDIQEHLAKFLLYMNDEWKAEVCRPIRGKYSVR